MSTRPLIIMIIWIGHVGLKLLCLQDNNVSKAKTLSLFLHQRVIAQTYSFFFLFLHQTIHLRYYGFWSS